MDRTTPAARIAEMERAEQEPYPSATLYMEGVQVYPAEPKPKPPEHYEPAPKSKPDERPLNRRERRARLAILRRYARSLKVKVT